MFVLFVILEVIYFCMQYRNVRANEICKMAKITLEKCVYSIAVPLTLG
jgi:hypothetical protein